MGILIFFIIISFSLLGALKSKPKLIDNWLEICNTSPPKSLTHNKVVDDISRSLLVFIDERKRLGLPTRERIRAIKKIFEELRKLERERIEYLSLIITRSIALAIISLAIKFFIAHGFANSDLGYLDFNYAEVMLLGLSYLILVYRCRRHPRIWPFNHAQQQPQIISFLRSFILELPIRQEGFINRINNVTARQQGIQIQDDLSDEHLCFFWEKKLEHQTQRTIFGYYELGLELCVYFLIMSISLL